MNCPDCYVCGHPCDAHGVGCLVVVKETLRADLTSRDKRIAELETLLGADNSHYLETLRLRDDVMRVTIERDEAQAAAAVMREATQAQADVLKAIVDACEQHRYVGFATELLARINDADQSLRAALASDVGRALLEERDALKARLAVATARRLESLLSTPCASEDFKEGVRRCMSLLRNGPTNTPVDGLAEFDKVKG